MRTREMPPGSGAGRPWLALVTLSLGAMTVSLDTTAVAVAQPAMQAGLGATIGDVQWVTAGYLLSLAALLVVAGKLGDRYGHRRLFLVGTTGFALTSAAIGLSTHIGAVIALRVVQGVFGAIMQPPTLALLRAVFPARQLTVAIAARSACLGIATAAGPVIGGLLVERSGWPAIFFVNLPVAAVAVALGLLILPEVRPDKESTSFDPLAVLMLSSCLAGLVWSAVRAPDDGWGSPGTSGALIASALLGAAFCWWESRVADPLLPLHLFRSPGFAAGVVLMALVAFAMFGVPFVLAFHLQNVLGMSPVECGVAVLWLTLAMVVAGVGTGLLMRCTGPTVPALAGTALASVAVLGLSRTDAVGSSPDGLRWWLPALGVGFSAVLVAATHLVVEGAPERYAGVAGGIQQTAMQVGGSLGTAVLGAVVAASVACALPGELAREGIDLTDTQLIRSVHVVATGRIPDGMAGSAEAARSTFVSAMNVALLVTACLMLLGGLAAAALLRRPVRTTEK